jgi:hypothetical protein
MQTKLPELKMWRASVQAVLTAFVLTLFPVLNLTVFWPILVLYFFVLLLYTLRRQVAHMARWGYNPFAGTKKTTYKGGH